MSYQGQNPEQYPNEYEQGYGSSPQQPPQQGRQRPYEQQQGGYQQQPGGSQPYNQPQGGYYQPGGNPQQQPPYGNNPNYQQPNYQQPPYNQQQQQQWFAGQPRSTLTTLGLDPRLESALSYVLFWVSGLIIFFLEKQNREVRYHALQSVFFFGGLNILLIIIGLVPFIGALLTPFLVFVWFVAWIALMVAAYMNYQFKIPVVSDYANRYADRTSF